MPDGGGRPGGRETRLFAEGGAPQRPSLDQITTSLTKKRLYLAHLQSVPSSYTDRRTVFSHLVRCSVDRCCIIAAPCTGEAICFVASIRTMARIRSIRVADVTVAPDLSWRHKKNTQLVLDEEFDNSDSETAVRMNLWTLRFISTSFEFMDLEREYLNHRSVQGYKRILRTLLFATSLGLLTSLSLIATFNIVALPLLAVLPVLIGLLVVAKTKSGERRCEDIAAAAVALTFFTTVAGVLVARFVPDMPGSGHMPGTTSEIPQCSNFGEADVIGRDFARRVWPVATAPTLVAAGFNISRDHDAGAEEVRYACRVSGRSRNVIVSLTHQPEESYDWLVYQFWFLTGLALFLALGASTSLMARFRVVHTLLAITLPLSCYIIAVAAMFWPAKPDSSLLFLAIFLPFGSIVTAGAAHMIERSDRTNFLKERRISRLLDYHRAKIREQSSQIKDMREQLHASQLMINRVMEESSAALRPYELAFSDIDFGRGARVKIGEGAFGSVYKARLRGEHDVAVKTMRVSKISVKELDKFKAELMIMCPLHHDNLVKLFGGVWNEGADRLCLVLEFCHKASLNDFLRLSKDAAQESSSGGFQEHLNGQIPSHPGEVLRIVSLEDVNSMTWTGVRHGAFLTSTRSRNRFNILNASGLALGTARALRYLHMGLKEPLIHRDVKPDNVLVSIDNFAKLADFGESRAFNRDLAIETADFNGADALTMTTVGTNTYCAPEVTLGERYRELDRHRTLILYTKIELTFPFLISSDEKVDTFSYALVLLCLVTGDVGYVTNQFKKYSASGVGYVYGWRPKIPQELCDGAPELALLIAECWQKSFRDRPTFSEVVDRIKTYRSLGSFGDEPRLTFVDFEGNGDDTGRLTNITSTSAAGVSAPTLPSTTNRTHSSHYMLGGGRKFGRFATRMRSSMTATPT